jgi:hypothetical protein
MESVYHSLFNQEVCILPSEKVCRLAHRSQVSLCRINGKILVCTSMSMCEYVPSCEININPMDTWGGGGSLIGLTEKPQIARLLAVHHVDKRLEVVLISFGWGFERTKITTCTRTTVLRPTNPDITEGTEFYTKYNETGNIHLPFRYVPFLFSSHHLFTFFAEY